MMGCGGQLLGLPEDHRQEGRQKNLSFLSGGPSCLCPSLSQHYFKNVTRGLPCPHPSAQEEGKEGHLNSPTPVGGERTMWKIKPSRSRLI